MVTTSRLRSHKITAKIAVVGQFQDVGQVGNLRADCQSAQTARVNNPLQDNILPHILKLTHYQNCSQALDYATLSVDCPSASSNTSDNRNVGVIQPFDASK